jgi:predicted SAM-dependent methyltransferase
MQLKKLELGSGQRPTEGYLHQDMTELDIPLDFCCKAWQVPVEEGTLSEVIAIAVMEHLRYADFRKTLVHVYNLLEKDGVFYFDVPDIFVWSEYLYKVLRGDPVPFTRKHIFDTLWGWQRWEGDEHKSAWAKSDVVFLCEEVGFTVSEGLEDIKKRVFRERFSRPENAHIYIKAVKNGVKLRKR